MEVYTPHITPLDIEKISISEKLELVSEIFNSLDEEDIDDTWISLLRNFVPNEASDLEKKMKSFKHWKYQEVQQYFGIEKVESLDKWLDISQEKIDEEKEKSIKKLQIRLQKLVNAWNEDTLKARFIYLLLDLVDFDTNENMNSFFEAHLEENLPTNSNEGLGVKGKVDFLISAGEQIPESPFFCIQEYKTLYSPPLGEEKGADPIGQLLIAMFVAQQKNMVQNYDFPMYGAYVIGRNWFFVVLEKNQYAISQEYIATREEVFDIFKILSKLKKMIQLK